MENSPPSSFILCVCVCVCVCEREREREREKHSSQRTLVTDLFVFVFVFGGEISDLQRALFYFILFFNLKFILDNRVLISLC